MGGGGDSLKRAAIGVSTGGLSEVRRGLKKLTKVPELPTLPDLPDAPTAGDPEVQAAKKKERKASRLRSGRQSTILSNLRQQLSPGRGAGGAGSQLG